ncbi:MAG: SHOCT domain-containing protein [Chloroflexi bacterium]|nr:SHOCT domain-containing protein [Chloroflexota bacterium]
MMMGFGFVGIVLVIIFVVVIIAALVGWRPQTYQEPSRRSESSPETARDILEKRYARGEISKQEFDQVKEDL